MTEGVGLLVRVLGRTTVILPTTTGATISPLIIVYQEYPYE